MKIRRWNGSSITNPSQGEGKLIYFKGIKLQLIGGINPKKPVKQTTRVKFLEIQQAAADFKFKSDLPARTIVRLTGLAIVLILAASITSLSAQSPQPFQNSPEVQSLVDANNAYAIDLYQKLEDRPGNLLFSPYCISSALAMTYAGARGQTRTEMANVLHFYSQTNVPATFVQLTARIYEIQSLNRIKLLMANSLWCQKDYSFVQAFLELIRKDYDAEAKPVDFMNAPEAAQNAINSWVAEKTDGKIQNFIEPGQISGDARLVLCNAIYFKGKWQKQFNPKDTRSASFYVATNQTVSVPMMRQYGDFVIKYDKENSVALLEMPYTGNDLSMIILLPSMGLSWHDSGERHTPLSDLEEKLTAANLRSWLRELDVTGSRKAVISVPRFSMTQSFDLAEQLKSLGMILAFSASADFSGMDGTGNLFISDVKHRAFMQVNEEGTEAAADTATMMPTLAMPPKHFLANHPFIFLIRDNITGAIFFMGRLINPRQEN